MMKGCEAGSGQYHVVRVARVVNEPNHCYHLSSQSQSLRLPRSVPNLPCQPGSSCSLLVLSMSLLSV